MKRALLVIVTIAVVSFFVSGCWSRRELNELAVASAIGIDKAGDQFRVSVQIIAPGEVTAGKSSGYETPVAVYSSTGKTLAEAIRKMTTVSPRKVHLSHLYVVVFGEELARAGIGKTIDYLLRDHEIRRREVYAIVAKGASAEETIKVLTHLDKIPAIQMAGSIDTMKRYWAPTVSIQLGEVSNSLYDENKNLVISGVEIKGTTDGDTKKNVEAVASPTYLKFSSSAVFRRDKLIGWLDEREGRGYNTIRNKVIHSVGYIPCADGEIAVEAYRVDTKLKAHTADGKPRIEVDVQIEDKVLDVQCKLDLTNPDTISELEKKREKVVTELIESAVRKAQQQYKTDIFGFGDVVRRSDPRGWQSLKSQWEQLFPDVPVTIRVDAKIRNLGTLNNTIHNTEE